MELMLVWRFLRKRWWIILLPVVVVAFVAVPQLLRNEAVGGGGFTTSFRYSAAQEQSNLPDRDGDYQDVWLASEFVVNAFTDWVSSSTFRDEITAMLDDESINLGLLEIAADNSRSIGIVYLAYPDGEALQDIASAAMDVLQTRNQAYFPHLGDEPAEVTIIDAPVIQARPASLPNRFAPILQLGVALFAGLMLALLVEYLDPTLRTADELEAQGIPILATVPRHRGGGR